MVLWVPFSFLTRRLNLHLPIDYAPIWNACFIRVFGARKLLPALTFMFRPRLEVEDDVL